MAKSVRPICVRLTYMEAKALADHLLATVKPSMTGHTPLEESHSALVDALCRYHVKTVLDKPE